MRRTAEIRIILIRFLTKQVKMSRFHLTLSKTFTVNLTPKSPEISLFKIKKNWATLFRDLAPFSLFRVRVHSLKNLENKKDCVEQKWKKIDILSLKASNCMLLPSKDRFYLYVLIYVPFFVFYVLCVLLYLLCAFRQQPSIILLKVLSLSLICT